MRSAIAIALLTLFEQVDAKEVRQDMKAMPLHHEGIDRTTLARVGQGFRVQAPSSRLGALVPRTGPRLAGSGSVLHLPTAPAEHQQLRQISAAASRRDFMLGTATAAVSAALDPLALFRSTRAASFEKPKKVLVLGATGFVGQKICKKLTENGVSVVGVSRRGTPASDATKGAAKYVSCDAANFDDLKKVVEDNGPFDAYVHAVGILFDTESGLSNLNKFISGSGSEPDSLSTYERVTKTTGFNAIKLAEDNKVGTFLFVSAAEAKADYKAPTAFIAKYNEMKREVEGKLKDSPVREVILRPSVIYTPEKPVLTASILPLFLANAVGAVEQPTQLEKIVDSAYVALCDPSVSGVLKNPDMYKLADAKVDSEELVQEAPAQTLSNIPGIFVFAVIALVMGSRAAFAKLCVRPGTSTVDAEPLLITYS